MTPILEHNRILVAGAGPAGLTLAYSLVRRGHPVTVLEQHRSFDREFRGELIQPGGLQVFDSLGLLDGVLRLDHARPQRIEFRRNGRPVLALDYQQLDGPYGAPILVPQPLLLQHLLAQCNATGLLTFLSGVQVRDVIRKGGRVTGLEVRQDGAIQRLPAELVVGCDGRFSTVRRQAGIRTVVRGFPSDVLWFTLPRPAGWPEVIRMEGWGDEVVLFLPNRGDRLQVGLLIPKGTYQQLRQQPIAWLHQRIAAAAPALSPVLAEHLPAWEDVTLLPVASEMAERWWQPGILLIGDAAHIMSPVAGQGINVALQDAISAARHLGDWLDGRTDLDAALQAFETERRPRVEHIQDLQGRAAGLLTARGMVPRILARVLPGLLQALGFTRRLQWTFAYGVAPA